MARKKKPSLTPDEYLAQRSWKYADPLIHTENYDEYMKNLRSSGGTSTTSTGNPNVQRDANGSVIPTVDVMNLRAANTTGLAAAAQIPLTPPPDPLKTTGGGAASEVGIGGVRSSAQTPAAPPAVAGATEAAKEKGFLDQAWGTATHWLSDLFNTDDTFEKDSFTQTATGGDFLGPVETVWDGMIRGLGWAGETATWGATGAVLAANPHYWANRDQGIEGNLWQDATRTQFGTALQGLVSPVQDVLGVVVTGEQQGMYSIANDIWNDPNLDIAEEGGEFLARQTPLTIDLPFSDGTIDMTPGEWGANAGNITSALVLDPANLAGYGIAKVGKLARVRYLNKAIVTADDTKRVVKNLDSGFLRIQEEADTLRVAPEDLDPEVVRSLNIPDEARTAWEVVSRRKTAESLAVEANDPLHIPQYEKRIPLSTLYNHDLFRWATNRDGLTAALHNAQTMEEVGLVIRHAANDATASQALATVAPNLLVDIINGERRLVNRVISAKPEVVAREATKWESRFKLMRERVEDLEKLGAPEQQILDARKTLDDVWNVWEQAKSGELKPVGHGPLATETEIEMFRKGIDNELSRSQAFIDSLVDAGGAPNGSLLGSLMNTPMGGFMDTGRSVLPGMAGALSERLSGRMMAQMGTSRMNRASRRALAQGRGGRMGAEIRAAEGIGGKARAAAASVKNGWKVDEFYGVSGRNVIARVLNWAGAERQSGLIYTSGISAQESAREVRAMLNGVDIYSGEARIIRAPKYTARSDGGWDVVKDKDGNIVYEEHTVGGLAAKEKMIEEYQMAMLQGGPKGDLEARALVDRIEAQILKDIAISEGVDPSDLMSIHVRQNRQLEKIAKEIQEEGYWLDEDNVRNYAPWLQTQLQNQSFVKNWRGIHQVVKQYARQQRASQLPVASLKGAEYRALATMRMTEQALDGMNSALQSVWRPAVLFRAGYTQRNVSEGLFRSMAYQQSLRPIADAGAQLWMSGKYRATYAGKKKAVTEAQNAAKAGADITAMPKKFQKWHGQQIKAAEEQIQQTETVLANARATLAAESVSYREARIGTLQQRVDDLQKVYAELDQNPFDNADKIDDVIDRVSAYEAEMAQLRAMTGGDADLDPVIQSVTKTLDTMELVDLEFQRGVRSSLDDMDSAVMEYKKQTMAHRRYYGRDSVVGDPDTLEGIMQNKALGGDAFAQSDRMAEIMYSAMSADATTRQAASLRMKAVQDSYALHETRYYVAVEPGDPNYFEGVATVLNQIQNSEIGRIMIRGRNSNLSDEEIVTQIVRYLHDDPYGQQEAMAINATNDTVFGGVFESSSKRAEKALRDAVEKSKPLEEALTKLTDDLATAQRNVVKAKLQKKSQTKAQAEVTRLQAEVDAARAELDEFIAKESLPKPRTGKDSRRLNTEEEADAIEYGQEVLRRFDQVTDGNEGLVGYLAANEQIPLGGQYTGAMVTRDVTNAAGEKVKVRQRADLAGEAVRQFLEGSDTLKPVIGNMAQYVGEKTFSQFMRDKVTAGFRIIGTIPEDTMVRSQFYGRTFQQHSRMMYDSLLAQSDTGFVSLDEVNAIRQQAHRRALKDTKDWLYTIDRRTKLGDSMEKIVPFVSATQNSVTAVGRLLWKDPRTAWWMAQVWQLPDRFGDMDGDGNPDTFMLPAFLLPPGVTSDKSGMVQFNKSSFDLLFNGVLDPQAGPLQKWGASEVMRNNLFGLSSETPEMLKSIPGSDAIWERTNNFLFGEDQGASENEWSFDKIMPPAAAKAWEGFLKGPGSSANFSRVYQSYMLTEQVRFQNGEREEAPTPDEVMDMTKQAYFLRALANLTQFTTPKYDTEAQVLADQFYKADQAYRADQALPVDQRQGVQPPEVLYGDMVAVSMRAMRKTRENVAGVQTTDYSARRARENEDVIAAIAPELVANDNLSALGILLSNPDSFYSDQADPYSATAAGWFSGNKVPGTNTEYRKPEDPRQALHDSQMTSAWREYMIAKEALEIDMARNGVASMESVEGMQYKNVLKYQVVPSIESKYPGFETDLNEQHGSKSNDVLRVLAKAFETPSFNERYKDDPVWGLAGPAATYMRERTKYLQMKEAVILDARSQGITSIDSVSKKDALYSQMLNELQAGWNATQAAIRSSSPAWSALQDRYIGSDDDPRDSGSMSVTIEEG